MADGKGGGSLSLFVLLDTIDPSSNGCKSDTDAEEGEYALEQFLPDSSRKYTKAEMSAQRYPQSFQESHSKSKGVPKVSKSPKLFPTDLEPK